MAASDYRLCDVCKGKTFYDARLNYEWVGDPNAPGCEVRNAGVLNDQLRLDWLGDWVVICEECAATHACIVVPKPKAMPTATSVAIGLWAFHKIDGVWHYASRVEQSATPVGTGDVRETLALLLDALVDARRDGELARADVEAYHLGAHARVCDQPACRAAIVRADSGARYCSAGHRVRWVDIAELDAKDEALGKFRAVAERARTVLVAYDKCEKPGDELALLRELVALWEEG